MSRLSCIVINLIVDRFFGRFVDIASGDLWNRRSIVVLDAHRRHIHTIPVAKIASPETPVAIGTVLIVEDDRDLLTTLKDMLEELGYRAICASNGREALARLEEETPSLLLVDLFMPVMGGIEFLHAIRAEARFRAIPKVIMTAANDHMVGVKEDVNVLYKPLDFELLTRVLEQYCQKARPEPSRH